MLQPCIVYIIWRLKEFLYVFIITLFIVLLKKNSLPFLYVYAFLRGGWKTSLGFSVCTAAGQNSWSEDMKPTERASRTHSSSSRLPAPCSQGQRTLIWCISSAKKLGDMVPALMSSFFTAAQVQAPSRISSSHTAAGVTGSRIQSFTF